MNSNISQDIQTSNRSRRRPNRKRRSRKPLSAIEWTVLSGLLLLSVVPALGGAFRVTQLTTGAEITPENARFFNAPVPVIVHIVGAVFYSIGGAFQFIPSIRRRNSRLHRLSGRILLPAGFAVALSGLWMTLFYPWPEGDGKVLYGMRLVVGPVMVYALCAAYFALRRDFKTHGAWMMRAYAIAMGAGTQVFTHLPWFLVAGMETPSEGPRAVMMGAGWVINMVVVEWFLAQRASKSRHKVPTTVATRS